MSARVFVVGSLNADLVLRLARAPERGETVAARTLSWVAGGKGANQAVAAARAGAAVRMVGCVGRDDAGRMLRSGLRAAGVDDAGVRDVDAPTGTAVILVEEGGDNRIVIVAGANAALRAEDAATLAPAAGDQVALQLEIAFEATAAAARAARARGATVHLNAAPADARATGLAGVVDHLIVNESEAELMCGRAFDGEEGARAAVGALSGLGFARVTLTLGERGALHRDGARLLRAPAPRVEVVDTTAAGDAFVGAWVAAEAAGAPPEERLRRAVAAGSLAVTSAGAQPSLPAADAISRLAGSVVIGS